MAYLRGLACLVLGACGSVSVMEGDGGGGGDGGNGIDADSRVTAIVRDAGNMNAPLAGVRVLFHAADGSVLEEIVTNDQGEAVFVTPAGGAVTVLTRDEGDAPLAMTVVGVEPGDVIPFTKPEVLGTLVSGYLTVSVPPPAADVTNIQFDIGCHEQWFPASMSTVMVEVLEGCLQNGRSISLLASEEGGANSRYSFVTDVSVGATISLPAWSSNTTRSQLLVQNVPPNVEAILPEVQMVRHGFSYQFQPTPAITMPPATSDQTINFVYVPGFYTHVQFSFFVSRLKQAGFQVWVNATDAPAASDAMNIIMDIPPPVTSSTWTAGDPAMISWSGPGDPNTSDAIFFDVTWPVSSAVGRWTLLGPPALEMLTMPQLPESAAEWRPTTAVNQPQVAFIDIADFTSFREVKRTYGPGIFRSEPPPGLRAGAALIGFAE